MSDAAAIASPTARRRSRARTILRNPAVLAGAALLAAMTAVAILAPLLAGHDPQHIDPLRRLKPPSAESWFGTDRVGRDVFSRTLWSARISLVIGAATAALALACGTLLGMLAGYVRALDAVIMRTMDGISAIPAVLLAVALMVLSGGGQASLVVAIALPNIPNVVRLIRSVVLTIREEPYIEAAIALGTPLPLILARHVLRNIVAPMIVIGSYVCAAAIMSEAILSFLGAGTPPEIPSWGNMITEGRTAFQIAPWAVFFPSIFLGITVFGVNLLGDGLRDVLDPRMAKDMR